MFDPLPLILPSIVAREPGIVTMRMYDIRILDADSHFLLSRDREDANSDDKAGERRLTHHSQVLGRSGRTNQVTAALTAPMWTGTVARLLLSQPNRIRSRP
jgi:hypothetical protein